MNSYILQTECSPFFYKTTRERSTIRSEDAINGGLMFGSLLPGRVEYLYHIISIIENINKDEISKVRNFDISHFPSV